MPLTTGNIDRAPKEYKECLEDIAKWLVKHRRLIRAGELQPIQDKYFATHEERDKFNKYVASPEGATEVKKILRLEAWKAGIAGPER